MAIAFVAGNPDYAQFAFMGNDRGVALSARACDWGQTTRAVRGFAPRTADFTINDARVMLEEPVPSCVRETPTGEPPTCPACLVLLDCALLCR